MVIVGMKFLVQVISKKCFGGKNIFRIIKSVLNTKDNHYTAISDK